MRDLTQVRRTEIIFSLIQKIFFIQENIFIMMFYVDSGVFHGPGRGLVAVPGAADQVRELLVTCHYTTCHDNTCHVRGKASSVAV